MRPATQAMQRDDSAEPGHALGGGRRGPVPAQPPLAQSKACIACHSATPACGAWRRATLRSIAALARPVSLSHRINLCRQRHQAMAEALGH
jgi:sulfur-oxidizing protein SoxA